MEWKRMMRIIFLVCLALLIVSCVSWNSMLDVKFKEPPNPYLLMGDADLYDEWWAVSPDKDFKIICSHLFGAYNFKVKMMFFESEEDSSPEIGVGYVTRIKGVNYFCFQPKDDKFWRIWMYKFKKDRLIIYPFMSREKIKKLARQGFFKFGPDGEVVLPARKLDMIFYKKGPEAFFNITKKEGKIYKMILRR